MGYEQMESVESVSSDRTGHCGCGLNCVCQVVRAIKDIQDEAVNDECFPCTTNCFMEPLGGLTSPVRERADTRVFTLTDKNGNLFKGLFRNYHGKCVSVFFRVEDVFDNCCATLRVLVPLEKDGKTVAGPLVNEHGNIDYAELCKVKKWGRSSSCITVDLHCFCAVQCIADCDLEICE